MASRAAAANTAPASTHGARRPKREVVRERAEKRVCHQGDGRATRSDQREDGFLAERVDSDGLLADKDIDGAKERSVDAHVHQHQAGDPAGGDLSRRFGERRRRAFACWGAL